MHRSTVLRENGPELEDKIGVFREYKNFLKSQNEPYDFQIKDFRTNKSKQRATNDAHVELDTIEKLLKMGVKQIPSKGVIMLNSPPPNFAEMEQLNINIDNGVQNTN